MIKTSNVQGIDYAYCDVGTGPAIIFAQGLFVDHSIFNSHIEHLRHHYRYISVDLPGHGASSYRSQGWTLDDLAVGMANFITDLKLESVVFVGLSQGGMIGMRLAVHFSHLVSSLARNTSNFNAGVKRRQKSKISPNSATHSRSSLVNAAPSRSRT